MSANEPKKGTKKVWAERELCFAREYIIDFNGTQAAIRAGVPKRGAGVWASRTLKKPNIADFIKNLIEKRNEATELKAADVLKMIRGVATANPNDLVEMRRGCCRYCWGQDGQYQYTRGEWATEQEKWEAKRDARIEAGKDTATMPALNIRGGIGFDPRKPANAACTECFGEGVVTSHIKDTRDLSEDALRLFGGVKETQHGIELKLNSQDGARLLLAKHTGLIVERVGNPDGTPLNFTPAPMVVKFVSPAKKAA